LSSSNAFIVELKCRYENKRVLVFVIAKASKRVFFTDNVFTQTHRHITTII